MSDIYCRTCDDDKYNIDSPACLNTVVDKNTKKSGHRQRNLLTVESEIEMVHHSSSPKESKKSASNKKHLKPTKRSKCCTVVKGSKTGPDKNCKKTEVNGRNNNEKMDECEYADDAIAFNSDFNEKMVKTGLIDEVESKLMIRVQGKEELPVVQQQQTTNDENIFVENTNSNVYIDLNQKTRPIKNVTAKNVDLSAVSKETETKTTMDEKFNNISINDYNGNKDNNNKITRRKCSTLPKTKKTLLQDNRSKRFPMRKTPDGTTIYYWCDVPKKTLKGALF